MNDTSLAEVIKQLDASHRDADGPEPSVAAAERADVPSLREDLYEGLRATEWLLSDLRERCRQLHCYRMRLIQKLERLEDGIAEGDFGTTDDGMIETVVPGPGAVQ